MVTTYFEVQLLDTYLYHNIHEDNSDNIILYMHIFQKTVLVNPFLKKHPLLW